MPACKKTRPTGAASGLSLAYGARHLLRHAAMAQQLAARSERAHARIRRSAGACARPHRVLKDIADFTTSARRGHVELWMSHGDRWTELRPASAHGLTESARSPAWPTRTGISTPCSPPRSHAPVQGKDYPEPLRADICNPAEPDWVMRDHVSEAVAKIREQVGGRGGHLAFRRRRFVGRAALIHAPSSPADLCFVETACCA